MNFDDNNEDAMFQEAAQTLIDNAASDTSGANADNGGMPNADDAPAAAATTAAAAPVDTTLTDTAATPPAPADAPPAPAPINFEGISGGLVKSPEDVTRISGEYVAMQKELKELREKGAVDPFANEYLKTLNQMYSEGKSADQVKAFMHLQDLGDISKLSPLDAMVEARVIRDGRDATIVKTMLERKYEITEDMNELDRKIAEEQMRDDAKADYEYLASQKKELATPAPKPNTDAALEVLSQDAIRGQVAPIKEKVKAQFTSLGQVNLNAKFDKDGKPTADAMLFELPIPKEYQEQVPQLLENYFLQSGQPVTPENLETAMGILQYELFKNYGVKLIQDSVNHAVNLTEKRIREEYENKGTNRPDRVHQPTNATDLTDAQMEKYAMGE